MSAPVVLLDACVLMPIRLASCLLTLAEAGLVTPLWSDEILDEVERNLPKLKGMTPQKASRRVNAMREAFDDEASVDGYQDLMPRLKCDAKDRHVLAAAIIGGAEALVTFNVKDFPAESADPYGVTIQDPDTLLLSLLAERGEQVLAALREDAGRRRDPTTTMTEYCAGLAATVPTFANLAHDQLGVEDGVEDAPVAPLVPVQPEQAVGAMGEPGDLADPAQVALVWWMALVEGEDEVLRFLTRHPRAWGDFTWARERLEGRSIGSHVMRLVDAPDDVAVVRFFSGISGAVQAFAAFAAPMDFLTLVRLEDGTWRVWGLGSRLVGARDIG